MEKKSFANGITYAFLVLAYFFSYFFRVSTSVVLPQIQIAWGLSAALVGFISSMYFYTYAIMQPLCGVLNDKIGPSRIVGSGLILTSLGALVFGLGSSVPALIIGRILMGIGLSPMLSGLLVFQSSSFSPSKYTFYSGLSMMIGNMGAVFSVAPLSMALDMWGMSRIFTVLSTITIIMSVVLITIGKKNRTSTTDTLRSMLGKRFTLAWSVVKSSLELRKICIVWMISFGSLMAFQGLWAVSWFKTAYPTTMVSSLAATMVGIGVMAGNLIGGYIGKSGNKRHRIINICTNTLFLLWILLLGCFVFKLPIATTMAVSTVLGIINGISFVQFTAAINEIAPAGQGGAVFGITNFFVFTCVIIYQWGTGVVVETLQQRLTLEQSFNITFTIVTILLIIPCIISHNMKELKKVGVNA
ncbi:MAG: MFS transporter [Firmicutes bacterium HGW-Firmicutes-15]|jgi:MFS family permease|nr:MAG: MFS transporter [Spirochaetae bacterium HGW-Spirochaetae-2]PKM75861.1 MAG: MFS transporter [Firmicutes bacterium HGW-Firmicutes-15]